MLDAYVALNARSSDSLLAQVFLHRGSSEPLCIEDFDPPSACTLRFSPAFFFSSINLRHVLRNASFMLCVGHVTVQETRASDSEPTKRLTLPIAARCRYQLHRRRKTMRVLTALLCMAAAVSARNTLALSGVSPSYDAYKHVCETTSFPDIPCFTFWRSDLKDAILGDELNEKNLLIKNDTYKGESYCLSLPHLDTDLYCKTDFGYIDVDRPFSMLFNEEVELLYGGRNVYNCTQFYVAKPFRAGRVDFAHARVEVRDEDGKVLHDSYHPHSGWASNCKKWTHIKVWHG